MYSWTNRINAVLTFGFMALVTAAAFSHVTHYFLKGQPTNFSLKSRPVQSLVKSNGMRYWPAADAAHWFFDLSFDLTPLWTWNTKQIFVWLQADYVTNKNVRNAVTIWDNILKTKESAKQNMKNTYTKYGLVDQGHNLRGANVTISLCYNEMPIAGLLQTNCIPLENITMPSEYLQLH